MKKSLWALGALCLVLGVGIFFLEFRDSSSLDIDKSGNSEIPEGADSATFVTLKGALGAQSDGPYFYAKDVKSVYYAGTVVSGANPNTFLPIENGPHKHSYGIDSGGIFYKSEKISGADARTFEILWKTVYEGCEDAHRVYFESRVVEDADPATFQVVHSVDRDYAKDKRGYYLDGEYVGKEVSPELLVCSYG